MKEHYAVIGDPVSHSRSPELYAPMFEKANIDADFLRLRVTKEELPRIREIVLETELSGFAVTMPHKRAIIPYLDAIDESAASAGSVNIVTVENGRLVGHNTDGEGLVNALSEAGVSVEGKTAVILGNGGAAAGAKAAIEKHGGSVRILVREHWHCGAVLPIEAVIKNAEHNEGILSSADILINATPLGMAGGEDFRRLDFIDYLKPTCTVFDMVYRPDGADTPLLAASKAAGLTAVGGERLLYHQGLLAFRLWTGTDAAPTRKGRKMRIKPARFHGSMRRTIKTKLLPIVFIFLFVLCACKGGRNDNPHEAGTVPSASPVPLHTEADFNNSLYTDASLVETDEAFLLCPRSGSELLMYFDKASLEASAAEPFGIMCGRPECTHHGSSCDAYFEDIGCSLALMNGRLYWVGRSKQGSEHPYAVYSADTDFTDKRLETELKFGYELQPQRICFHRGSAYIVSIMNSVGNGGEPLNNHKLVSCDLDTGEPKVLIDYNTVNALSEFTIRFKGSKVYYAEGLYVSGCDMRLYCYDTETEELEVLLSDCHTIETPAYMRIDDDGTVYMGDYGIPATLFKVLDGELVPIMEFEKYYRIHPFEKAVVGTSFNDDKYYAWFRSYSGETLYKGILPTETIDGDPETFSAYWVCGDGEYIIVLYEASSNGPFYFVRYELADGTLRETLMGYVDNGI